MARNKWITDIMEYEERLGIIPIHRYDKDWLNVQTEEEIFRIHKMLRELKEAQNPNA